MRNTPILLGSKLFKIWFLAMGMSLSLSVTGQRFNFQKIGLEEGIPSLRINDFMQDSRGYFWLATEGGGVARFDGYRFSSLEAEEAEVPPVVQRLCEDRQGQIWLLTERRLVRYDGQQLQPVYLPTANERLVAFAPSGSGMWAATSHHLYRWTQGDSLELSDSTAYPRIYDLAWWENELWLATEKGLYRDGQKVQPGAWTSLLVQGDSLRAQSQHTQLTLPATNRPFLRGDYFHQSGRTKAALRHDSLLLQKGSSSLVIAPGNGLPRKEFKGCYVDRDEVLWLFSNQGLTRLTSTAFRLFDQVPGEVLSVAEHQGEIMAGTQRGLLRIRGNETPEVISAAEPFGLILALAHFDNKYWLGTESGLLFYDGQRFVSVPLGPRQSEVIFALHATDEALWIGTGSGIYRYREGETSNLSQEANMPPVSVFTISEGRDRSLWFATYTQGLYRYQEGGWQHFRQMGGLPLDSLRFSSMSAVNRDQVWLGTQSEGLFLTGREDYEHFEAASLGFAEIRSLSTDKRGQVWMGTNKGLHRLSYVPGQTDLKFFEDSRQLLEDGCSPQALLLAGQHLLVGTPSGLLRVELEELEQKRPPPPLSLTGVQLFFGEREELQEFGRGRAGFTALPQNPVLPHNLNFLSFTLAGITGYEPGELLYRYRIKPEQDWALAGNRREAVFSNLSPGYYEFQAQVTRPGTAWTGEIINYPFRIRPPLWQQSWFITLALLLLGGGIYFYLRARIARIHQRLRMENSLMEMERKALRLQMNPHFIFNALDSISSFIFKENPREAVRYLNHFAKLMRLTLESSMEHLHPVESEVSILKNYLELEKLRFQGQLNYRIEMDEEIDYDVGIPPMLIQPHVENAILHGIKPKEGPGTVVIRFKIEGEQLVCEVEDDGIGRQKARELTQRKDHRSMATEINRHRLELLRKSMGSKVTMKITDRQNPTGTLVVIVLPLEEI